MSESFLRGEADTLQDESVDFLPKFSRNEFSAQTAVTWADSSGRAVSEFGPARFTAETFVRGDSSKQLVQNDHRGELVSTVINDPRGVQLWCAECTRQTIPIVSEARG